MSRKLLDNVNGGCTWTSYISSVNAVLKGAGMWNGEVYLLMGMTGMAFHFITHENCCPSSVTVYDWVGEHVAMMDRIGVDSDMYSICYDTRLNTYGLKQQDAIRRIKESIDRGVGVVVWAPTRILEFGYVKGYDDEDGVFLVGDCTGQDADPLLYTNLGKSEVPMLSYQIFGDKVEIEPEKAYRESLKYAVGEWNKEFHINPSYASGRKGYDYMIRSLEKGDFNAFGLAYALAVYADSKACAVKYIDHIVHNSQKLKGLEKAGQLYGVVAEQYGKMTGMFPFSGENGAGCTADRSKAPEILALLKECRELEDKAMAIIEETVGS